MSTSRAASPADMPRRRLPQVPVRPPTPAPPATRYEVAVTMPRRGWSDSSVWLDTGILLSAGTNADTLDRFRSHYANRASVGGAVDWEVRKHTEKAPAVDAPESDHARYNAAVAAVKALLVGPSALPVVRLNQSELALVEPIKLQLAALSNGNKSHGGEAELIVLATRAARSQPSRRQVILTNDGAASVVAHGRQLPSRHAGDVLAELACADESLDCESCWARFNVGHAVSGIPRNARPGSSDDFNCRSEAGNCAHCEALSN